MTWQKTGAGSACASATGQKQAIKPTRTKDMKSIVKLAIAASMLAMPLSSYAGKACDACCKDKGKTCASCCKDAGKECGKDCCKAKEEKAKS